MWSESKMLKLCGTAWHMDCPNLLVRNMQYLVLLWILVQEFCIKRKKHVRSGNVIMLSCFVVTLSSAPQFFFWISFGISWGSSWAKEIRHLHIPCILFLINLLRKFVEAIGELRKYLFSGPFSAVPFPVLPYLNFSLLVPTALTLQALLLTTQEFFLT